METCIHCGSKKVTESYCASHAAELLNPDSHNLQGAIEQILLHIKECDERISARSKDLHPRNDLLSIVAENRREKTFRDGLKRALKHLKDAGIATS